MVHLDLEGEDLVRTNHLLITLDHPYPPPSITIHQIQLLNLALHPVPDLIDLLQRLQTIHQP